MKLAYKEYQTKHDCDGNRKHCELYKKLKFDHTVKGYTLKPE